MTIGIAARGFSNAARYIDEVTSGGLRDLQNLKVFGNKELVIDELWTVWQECREANWDGFHARPVSVDTYRNAHRLLEALPLGYPAPSVGAEPDGALTLEWHRSASRTLSISVNPDYGLDFAGLYGRGSRVCGTEDFFDEVPDPILKLIHRVYAA